MQILAESVGQPLSFSLLMSVHTVQKNKRVNSWYESVLDPSQLKWTFFYQKNKKKLSANRLF